MKPSPPGGRDRQIYNYAFENPIRGDYGKATALSLMLAGFLAVFSLVYLRATRSWSQDE
jgi:multiple sugar transport system permease protein